MFTYLKRLRSENPQYQDGWNVPVILLIIGFYLFALGGMCFPSWEGLALLVVLYWITGLGVTVWYHRYFTHQSFETTCDWVWMVGAVAGLYSGEGAVLFWVLFHTLHHAKSDTKDDPHSPLHGGFWHAHQLWMMALTGPERFTRLYVKYTPKELRRKKFLVSLNVYYKYWHYGLIAVLSLAGFAYGYCVRSEVFLWFRWETVALSPALSGAYFAASFLGYGYFLRMILVLNATWSVNSFSHLFGSRPYKTDDGSRNNWLVALFTFGEGWHNNHHACPTAYSHGQRWWQIDMSAWIIRAMKFCRLAKNLKEFKPPRRYIRNASAQTAAMEEAVTSDQD